MAFARGAAAAALLLAAAAAGCTGEPLVVFMDSAHPARVYDEETRAQGRTNADLLAERLGDLPARTVSETTSPTWERDGAIAELDPELVVIHYSGFREEDGTGPRERLGAFIARFGGMETEFLVYSRTLGTVLDDAMAELLAGAAAQHPTLLPRVHVFGLDDHGERSWLSAATLDALRERVMEILER